MGRIIIHLSDTNHQDLNVYYLDALIADLKNYDADQRIDIILITGDLVDRGGDSLGPNPYKIFQDEFIDPICKALNLLHEQVLFIPGNHDIERQHIDEQNEFFLSNKLTKDKANEELEKQKQTIQISNKRIERFKNFEKEFHSATPEYTFSLNESLAIKTINNSKIGFALINDSWRCSSELKKEQHFIGTTQIKNAKQYFEKIKTDVNIALFHHPLEEINSTEKDEIENLLQSFDFDLALFGHSHLNKYESVNSSIGGVVYIKTRAGFNDPDEVQAKYQSGYAIIDIDVAKQTYTLHVRKFINNGYRFDKDVDSLPNGRITGLLNKKPYVPLSNDVKTDSVDLPNGYSADVNKIVKLLIGKSLYPDDHIFVRELIQNSVDACRRAKELNNSINPRIYARINTADNSFEIIDEGDGMSKKTLRNHFSIVGKSISQEFSESLRVCFG